MDQILLLGASPTDEEALPIEEELELLKARLQQKSGHLAKLSSDSKTRLEATALTDLLKRSDFDILHLVGHGEKKAFLSVGKQGQSVELLPSQFVNILKLRDPLKLVVLSACYSGAWVNEFLRVADAVVAMPAETYAISAREFSVGLYENLYSGMSLKEAVENATLLMRHLGDTTTKPIAESREEFGGPEHTYLYRKPELLARFETEPPRVSRKGRTAWYSITAYIRFPPHRTDSVRAATYIEKDDETWEFHRVELDGGDFEFPIECWGNTGALVLIEHQQMITAIRANVVQMLKEHYALDDTPPSAEIKQAIESIRRDGKLEKKQARGVVVGAKRAAKKPAARKAKV